MVFQIAYMSAALPGLTDADVHGILKASNTNNRRDGLSGMLLLIDGTFFQVLEGQRERVEETYRRIARDPRHSALIRVLQQERAERTFPDWSMGFEKFMKIDDLGEALPFDASDLSRDPSIARLREKAPELVSFMRALYASRGMHGAPKLD
ncbi:BLUF domain-containing protein [Parvibaculum sp.]|jgi:hypothetical protein|uniref:BLUF domain-containing protein n=1 Tax=Parvibaculum sp. TaxID=2024848 RepID=UPI000C64E79E|nr:BLUF domain-containing protein [Parvibaculum sp.]HAC60090.1 hypothetical protein [Rhodobiaceae bacterium]MAU61795.1 hypothetical protein [Parvibaculum sp.]MBO6666679.1 BLUF domain-containing protein [Parvibaculum sp.]MBO6691582.1 BLUF domain-containing protein [Parvibaculum sp.]MBO6713300.1 BLUF domain-containing protein [Parvibaculum sp.]|tara:strand:- start:5996 stop:6448 length:453 start_codon:yes stop_codon:yes gene_type:complete